MICLLLLSFLLAACSKQENEKTENSEDIEPTESATADTNLEEAKEVEEGKETEADEFALSDLPDAYAHATVPDRKELLEGEDFDKALQFLADSSHYLYVNRATPFYGNFKDFPDTGFDTSWRSPLNGRVYRGPFNDPLSRSVIWMSMNPNGGVNASVGSYWACIPPNTELEIKNNELQGYEPKPEWQIVAYMGPGQTVENYIKNGRGSMYVDASLVSNYGVPAAWEDRNVLNLELKLDHYVRREVSPEQFYDGLLPTTATWKVPPLWQNLPGWDKASGENQFRTIAQFWGCATGEEAELNLNTDEERAAYLKRANQDPAVRDILNSVDIDLYFTVEQIVNVKQQIGFDFEQATGKVNAIDMDKDGYLDKYPEGHPQAGEIIFQNAYGLEGLPAWIYTLNFDEPWWIAPDGSGNLIDERGKIIVGVNPDGNYIYQGEDGDLPTEESSEESSEEDVALAENERLGKGKGHGGELIVKVTMDGEKIEKVEVLSHSETKGTSDPAIAEMPGKIVEANSADVDAVGGATETSNGIKEAVKNAMHQE